jgi:murein DD-endopeptidase MepM/ murein hydrolase activator NlpD
MQKAQTYISRLPDFKQWLSVLTSASAKASLTNHVQFRWPMRSNSNYDMLPQFYTLSNYMDINRDTLNFMQDWYCTSNNSPMTYRNHEGNDYSLYPFFWRMMDNKNVFACAAAPGIVINVRDTGNNDHNCMRDAFENNSANYVAILHVDSSITRYLHIKKNSARVMEGQYVEEGTLLANIGSSGHSSNPHLHFDLKFFRSGSGQYNFVEPFKKNTDNSATPCNRHTDDSWWKNQKTYIDPKLNRVMTHYGTPYLTGDINFTYNNQFCPEAEDPKVKNQFNAGEQVYVGLALVHVNDQDSIHYTVYYPNGTVMTNVSRNMPNTRDGYYVNFRNTIYLTNPITLPANAPSGTYTIKAELIYRPFNAADPYYPTGALIASAPVYHYFTVGCISSQTLSGVSTGEHGYIVGNDLNSTQQVSGRSTYQSGNYIQLNAGFVAPQGVVFKAKIKDCNSSD